MRSEGMAKEMPAATLSVLMPMTSPSWAGTPEQAVTPGARAAPAFTATHRSRGPRLTWPAAPLAKELRRGRKLSRQGALGVTSGQGPPPLPSFSSTPDSPSIPGACGLGELAACPAKQCPLTQDTPRMRGQVRDVRGTLGTGAPSTPSF